MVKEICVRGGWIERVSLSKQCRVGCNLTINECIDPIFFNEVNQLIVFVFSIFSVLWNWKCITMSNGDITRVIGEGVGIP